MIVSTRIAANAVLLAASVGAGAAMAQQPASQSANPPKTAASSSASAPAAPASASPMAYRSAFEGYRGLTEQPVQSWSESNDTVGRIGGWQVYAREGQGEGKDAGAMKNMPGMSMPGMESKPTSAPSEKAGGSGHDMSSMKAMPGMSMPGMDSKPAGASADKESTGGRRTDSMNGMGMGGMDSKPADSSSRKDGAAGREMGSMKGMPDTGMPGMNPKPTTVQPTGKDGANSPGKPPMKGMSGKAMSGMESSHGTVPGGEDAAAHDAGATKDMPGKTMAALGKPVGGESMSKDSRGAMTMSKPSDASAGAAQGGRISGTGVVRSVDKINSKVKLTHDPIAELGWPRMTMFFGLKEKVLAEKIKEGDVVDFDLEKSAGGYVISGLKNNPLKREAKKMN